MKITLLVENNQLKVFINNLPHIMIIQSELIGFQSWIGENERYYIEFYTKTQDFYTEYDNKLIWTKILKLLNKL